MEKEVSNKLIIKKIEGKYIAYRSESPGFFGEGATRKEAESNLSSKAYSALCDTIMATQKSSTKCPKCNWHKYHILLDRSKKCAACGHIF